jgi:alkylhydroperoxidase/carboxymuconolactone decarboxylase family protein YurZ
MDQLYGKERSEKVYDRLESLNPGFNRAVQDIAYDYFWTLPGLSLRDKSFVTLVSLIVLHKEEQTRIHYDGFLNADGTKEELIALLNYLKQFVDVGVARQALEEVLHERSEVLPNAVLTLSLHDEELANLAAVVALSDKGKIKAVMRQYLDQYSNAQDKIQYILMQQVVYCGFPTAMNGFAILKELIALS